MPVGVGSGSSHCAILPKVPEFLLDIEVNSKEIGWGFPWWLSDRVHLPVQGDNGFDPWSQEDPYMR